MEEYIETDTQYLDDETTCCICYAEFLDTEDLNIHITQIHLNEASVKRFCNLCHSIFPDIEQYVLHLKDYHLKSLQWCKHCTRVFFNTVDLKQHELKHGESTLKSCSQCEESFLNNAELEAHEYNNHKDHVLSEGIMMQECFPIFSSALHMNVRKFFTVPYTHQLYSCINCDLVTSDIDIYLQHLKTENKTPYTCDKCCNVFKEKYKLKIHLRGPCKDVHSEDMKKCNVCKKRFEFRLFKKHTKNCLGLQCMPCSTPYNGTVSNYTDNLLAHKKTIPLLTCKFCHRQFVGNVALTKHIDRTHKASFHLYKYKCVTCDQLFKHPKLLFTHYFSKHKDLHPYTCKICDKKYRVRKGFTLHIKLDHKSVGFVEFDENYHVFFSDKKSENPFQPQSLIHQSDVIPEQKSNATAINMNITDEIDLTNMNSDFMNATETECETDVDKAKQKVTLKRKKPIRESTKDLFKQDKQIYETEVSSNDSDAPLITMTKTRSSLGRNNKTKSKKKFICTKCDKNCYTYQNYHHHMSLHTGCKLKKCIKCDKKFKSTHALQKHIERKHTSSKLTETLKQVLERRKNPNLLPRDRQSISEGFRRSIQKVIIDENNISAATIKLVENGLSAKKFIESFTPDEASKDIKITSSITLKEVSGVYKPQLIKMTKFCPEPAALKHKLRMPVKFKPENATNVKASIKLVQQPISTVTKPILALTSEVNHVDHSYTDTDFYENNDMILDEKEEIPEVAEEVMLNEVEKDEEQQGKEHQLRETKNSIIIPNLPQDCEDVRIGHLQAQAPYYKIVKMKDVLKTVEAPKKSTVVIPPENVMLPDGTKLVTVNPLAHLLGNTNVEELLKTKKKHYEPKIRDIRSAIEKAMKGVYQPKRKSSQNIC